MRKKFIAGAAVLALLMNSPQVKADEIVVFGSEFEDETPAPKKVTKPAPIKELPPPEEKPAPLPIEDPVPPPIEEPVTPPPPSEEPQLPPTTTIEEPEQTPPPIEEKPEIVEPQDRPQTQPVEQSAEPEPEPAQVPPQEVPVPPEEDDDDLGDTLVFDDLSKNPDEQPVEQPIAQPSVEQPFEQSQGTPQIPDTPEVRIELPPVEPEPEPPVEQSNDIPSEDPVKIVPPTPRLPATPEVRIELPPQVELEPETPVREQTTIREQPTQPVQPARRSSTRQPAQPQQKLKTLKPRFTKLAVDDTYTYYLDKNSVQWKKMPYSSSEYIADVWIRMVERKPAQLDADMASYGEENFNAEISLAREQGYQYSPEDVQVLSSQAYVLEHYYLRPKTRQIQFLCELEVFGRPQNTISERVYDYKNWENLVPGSVESVIYDAVIKIVGKSKASERGHMTFIDMLDEYARIALN